MTTVDQAAQSARTQKRESNELPLNAKGDKESRLATSSTQKLVRLRMRSRTDAARKRKFVEANEGKPRGKEEGINKRRPRFAL